MEGWNFWWGIAAFFLGGLATQLNGWLAYRRQRKDRADDVADALRQRREEFELQHLVEVSELLRQCMKCWGHLTLTRWRNETLNDALLTEEHREELRTAEVDYVNAKSGLGSQIGFVFDGQVRQKVKEASEYMNRTDGYPVDPPERAAVLLVAHAKVNDAYEVLTARVRELYAGRAAA